MLIVGSELVLVEAELGDDRFRPAVLRGALQRGLRPVPEPGVSEEPCKRDRKDGSGVSEEPCKRDRKDGSCPRELTAGSVKKKKMLLSARSEATPEP
jgi:hypothetical protein